MTNPALRRGVRRSASYFWVTAAAAAILAGCAANQCDPRQSRSVLVAAGCVTTGGTDAFLDNMRAEYAMLVEKKRLTDLERRSLALQARAASRDAAVYRSQIAKQKTQIAALRSDVSKALTESAEERARRQVVLEELETLQARLAQEEGSSAASEAEILKLREDIAKREAVLRAMSAPIIVD